MKRPWWRRAVSLLPHAMRVRGKRFVYGSFPGMRGSFPYFGERVFFPPGSHLFERVCAEGVFEASLVAALNSLVRPGTVYIDVGANIGLMSVPILASVPECTVLSFEPSPNSLPFLRRTWEASLHKQRWTVVGKAAAERQGEAPFSLGPMTESAFEGFLDTGRKPEVARTVVEVTTLDDEWQERGCPAVSVIKSDTEGAELRVLRGAKQCIKACRPAIFIEWNAMNLKPYGIALEELVPFANEMDLSIHSFPDMVPISNAAALAIKCQQTETFLLLPRR